MIVSTAAANTLTVLYPSATVSGAVAGAILTRGTVVTIAVIAHIKVIVYAALSLSLSLSPSSLCYCLSGVIPALRRRCVGRERDPRPQHPKYMSVMHGC
jgi:hypothetical protein